MSNNQPIGFIDSGFGGLTVVKEALKQLPNETIYFLGDSKRCPYGPRSSEEVVEFTFEMANFLLQHNIKMLVIACNTATAAAIHLLKEQLDIPVVGVIASGSREAIKETTNQKIGVIGTVGTINSGIYEKTLHQKLPSVSVYNLACPTFVDIVENNQMNTQYAKQSIYETLIPLQHEQVDTLILGCTHYPLLKKHIEATMGDSVTLIDSGVETVTDVSMLLDYFDIACDPKTATRQHRFFTTGDAQKFELVASKWLNRSDISVETVDITQQGPIQMTKEIIVATHNVGKVKEFKMIFEQRGYTVKTLLDFPDIDEVEETGTTFEENARLKAETISRLLNRIVIADDSGLIVDALDGQPGVYSARYAGEPKNDARNRAKLLAEMAEVSDDNRQARFHTTIVMAIPNEESIVVTGELEGQIAMIPAGENGFGYDPLFYVPSLQKTTAQLEPEEKNAISHRGKAIKKLIEVIDNGQYL